MREDMVFQPEKNRSAEKVGENALIFETGKSNRELRGMIIEGVKEILPILEEYNKKIAVKFASVGTFFGHGKQEMKYINETGEKSYEITLDLTFMDVNQVPEYFLHEIGHIFEEDLINIADENNKTLPENTGGQLYADIFASIIMRRGVFEFYKKDYKMIQDIIWCYDELIKTVKTDKLREILIDGVNKAKDEKDVIYRNMLDEGVRKEELVYRFFPWKKDGYVFEPMTMRLFDYVIMKAEEAEK